MTMKADEQVDALYNTMRGTYGAQDAGANGYRFHSFFEREQRLLLDHLDVACEPILDVACGSGLMLLPLQRQGVDVSGLDFNEDACADARANGFPIVQGDAFNLPFPANSFGQIVNCQFLNQQPADKTQRFVEEAARVLRQGGSLLILWRHADSLLHRSAHAVFRMADRVTGNQPGFPQYSNPLADVERYASEAGLSLVESAVTLPVLRQDRVAAHSIAAKLFGASLFARFEKPDGPQGTK